MLISDVWSAGCVLAELLLGQPIFPGDSGVDQLVEIIKVLGTPSREQITEMNPNYTEFKFPQIKSHPWQKVNNVFVFFFLYINRVYKGCRVVVCDACSNAQGSTCTVSGYILFQFMLEQTSSVCKCRTAQQKLRVSVSLNSVRIVVCVYILRFTNAFAVCPS